jgi:nucleotide-binding universal stress UspA family protein
MPIESVMRRLVVVGLDGSEKDGRAIAAAVAVGKLSESDLHFVRIIDDPLAGVVRDPREEVVGLHVAERVADTVVENRTDAEAALASVVANLGMGGDRVATWAVLQAQDVGVALIDHAVASDALLIVLATRAPRARSRAIVGSVADYVMRESPRPVILVPPGATFMAGKEPTVARVLVPLDDSSLSFRSLEFIVDLPRANELEYVLVEVVAEERARATAQTRLEKSAAWLRSRGVKGVEVCVLESADAAEAIVGAVRDTLVDAIAMSTRGAGGLGRLILGSVAEKVVRNSELPVMLLTPRVLAQQ